MKTNTHPTYYPNAKVTCSCGHKFTTGSTLPEIQVDICASCHPFFTGEMKFVDTQGRVEKFQAMRAKAQTHQQSIKNKKRNSKQEKTSEEAPKTLKEMMQNVISTNTPTKKTIAA